MKLCDMHRDELEAIMRDAVALANEVTEVLAVRYPEPSGRLELALLVIASGMARRGPHPLVKEQFEKLAGIAYAQTVNGEPVRVDVLTGRMS